MQTLQMTDGDATTIDRRTVVRRIGAVTGTLALAGCTGDDENEENEESDESRDSSGEGGDDVETTPEFVEIEDRPEAVYVPTHREAMRTLEPVEAGEYAIAPMLSYPHPFWVIAGGGEADDEVERVAPEEGRGVHMMFTLWDATTGTVLPVDEGAQIRVEKDGEQVGTSRSPWPMISQEMGFHFGDNVALPEDGTYTVEVTIPPLSTRKTGALEGRLNERATATFEFEYDEAFRREVVGGVEYLDEAYWGERGALEPMAHGDDDSGGSGSGGDRDGEDGDGGDQGQGDERDGHHVPYSALPEVDAYPGTLLEDPDTDGDAPETTTDLPRTGDAAVLATVLESGSRLADDVGAGDDERYLLVSPRTPYNRVPLADMSLRVAIERDGEPVVETALEQTLDDEYGLHYGASLAASDVEPGDAATITVESPPQVSRHRGYETAFLEMPPVELAVPERGEVTDE